MNPRHLIILSLLSATILIASLSAVIASRSVPRHRVVQTSNPLLEKPNMVDRLDFIDTAAAFDRATLERTAVNTSPNVRISLVDPRPRAFPREGTWTSEPVETAFKFTELIPSWNAAVPHDTGVYFHVKTRNARSGTWSPWLYMGQWGRTPLTEPEDRLAQFDYGIVHVDNLTLDRPADAYQIRATLLSFAVDRTINPSIRRMAVSYSGAIDDANERTKLQQPPKIDGDWARSLPVPFRAQGVEARPLAGSICSPTSTSMVMSYFGVDRPTQENALAIYDEANDMFGNWGRAVQRAGELGLDAWVARFRNWDQVKAMIARDQPVVAGIKFKAGEFPSALYPSTGGHLIVIRGFTREGDVIVNDPADRNKGNGVVYKSEELARAWFGCGGVGYVIRKPQTPVTRGTSPATAPSVLAK